MYRIRTIIIFYTGLLLCMACTKESQEDTYLQIAMQEVDEHPKEALTLLEEIPYPEYMDLDSYMRYIVTLTQARYMDYQDITGDTLILEAQRYFAGKQEYEPAARASYYAAAYWCEKDAEDKELEYALLAHYFAKLAGNNLFLAKSAHWIGSMYFNLDRLDSAMVYFQQALELYDREPGTQKLGLILMLGRTYLGLNQFDQAYTFLENGLEITKKSQNKEYEPLFLNNLGMLFTRKKAYQQAKDCFNQALSLQSGTEEDIARIYLNYARLYRAMNQLDSIRYYLKRVEERIPEISYPYTRKAVYQELATYYKNERNVEEMEHFLNLKNKEELLIKDLQSEKKIQAANERFEASQRKMEQAKQKYNQTWKVSMAAVIALSLLLLIFWWNKILLKKKYKKVFERYITHTTYMQEYLAENLIYISGSMRELTQKTGELILPHSVTWQHFQKLRTNVYIEIESLMREMLQKSPQGLKALSLLKLEDLSIIFLYRLKMYSDENIKYMLGYELDATYDVAHKRHHIRGILATAGMRKREINRVFLEVV